MTSNMPLAVGLSAALLISATSFAILTPFPAAIGCVLGWAMLWVTLSDARAYIVPDIVSLPAIPIGLAVLVLLHGWPQSSALVLEHTLAAIAGAALFYAIRALYQHLRHREGLGLGDVKLAGVAGAWTGWTGWPYVVLAACAGAFCFVILQYLLTRKSIGRTTKVPFGAFLAPAVWIIWTLQYMRLS